MRPQDQDAVAFVEKFFADYDHGFTPTNLVARDARGASGDEVDAVDVDFAIPSAHRLTGTMSVWYDRDGNLTGEF